MPRTKHRKLSSPAPSYSTPSSSHSSPMEPSWNLFPSKAEFPRLLAVIAIAASVVIACNFVVGFLNRQPKPFCDSNADLEDFVSDFCEPCPRNGVCYEGNLECVHGYRKHGKSCIEDGNINETARKLIELAETHTCEAYAQYLCDGTGTIWFEESKLWNYLDDLMLMGSRGLDNAIYMFAKQRAMENVGKLLETRTNIHGIKELKCPDLLVEHHKPVTCYSRQWVVQHAIVIVSVCALLVACRLILSRGRQRHYLSVRAEKLYNKVCDILEENAWKSVNADAEPWVVASWLRDHLLSPKERKDPLLWKKVEELVQEDSRLARYPRIVKGDAKVVWEWQVEGSLSSSGKRKKSEESKPKFTEGMNVSSHQQYRLKIGEPLN